MQPLRLDEENTNPMNLHSQETVFFSATNQSQPISENIKKPDECTIEEAESSLQGSNSLNCEEARAVLGRYEYQTGNIEAALHVFNGIDIAAVTPKIKISLSDLGKPDHTPSNNYGAPPFSINTVGLLLEAAYLKSKSLQNFGRYKEAAESCKLTLDIIESSLPDGLPENVDIENKLQDTLTNTLELLPYLYQLANSHHETILSYRRALLRHSKYLNNQTIAKIQKEFVLYLLYCGGEEAYPPNLVLKTDASFVPKSNIEEAILLLMILLRDVSLKKIERDPSILDHLSYALSIAGGLGPLGKQLEELLPGIIDDNEKYLLLALCCYGTGDASAALNLLKIIYKDDQNPNCGLPLLLASKIHVENPNSSEGVMTAKRAIQVLKDKSDDRVGVGYYYLGVSLSACSRSEVTECNRVDRQHEALECLETAGRLTRMVDSRVLYDLSLENAEQRKLDAAFGYAKRLLYLEGGSHVKGWMLLARILSAQKRFGDGESIIDAALDQTENWDHGELLRTKAKLQLAQGEVKRAIQTYTRVLAVLQVKGKGFGLPKTHFEDGDRTLELEIWNDLAKVYISLSQWPDAEACLVKSKAISNYSASTRHTVGFLYEAKGLHKQALKLYKHALDVDPAHVESLVSIAGVFRKLGGQSGPVARSFLNEALRVDRMHSSAWYNLGLLLRDEGSMGLREAADCFEAAGVLKETEPIEPFR
ncbi:putative tetratricopeptide-like helical domain superfamily, acetyltransferase A, auxiliary subunit [Helianthus annuus]|nr:putative tetratricopeptide-like helical domain superfamily, acetyltransferase A, auxiliary subunit [Helianthus annuus]